MPVKLSGEYWRRRFVSEVNLLSLSATIFAPSTAICFTPSLSWRNTTRRCKVEVELYKCKMAFLVPCNDSMVRSIKCSLAWVKTCTVTSSGMWPPSINSRKKLKSVSEAEGKPTSISLKPIATRILNMRILRNESIGSISAWLPSRRSTEHQVGAFVIIWSGHVLSAKGTAA